MGWVADGWLGSCFWRGGGAAGGDGFLGRDSCLCRTRACAAALGRQLGAYFGRARAFAGAADRQRSRRPLAGAASQSGCVPPVEASFDGRVRVSGGAAICQLGHPPLTELASASGCVPQAKLSTASWARFSATAACRQRSRPYYGRAHASAGTAGHQRSRLPLVGLTSASGVVRRKRSHGPLAGLAPQPKTARRQQSRPSMAGLTWSGSRLRQGCAPQAKSPAELAPQPGRRVVSRVVLWPSSRFCRRPRQRSHPPLAGLAAAAGVPPAESPTSA